MRVVDIFLSSSWQESSDVNFQKKKKSLDMMIFDCSLWHFLYVCIAIHVYDFEYTIQLGLMQSKTVPT